MKKTKIQIKSCWGDILFEHECADNSIKKAVEKAVEDGANLDGANLDGASLDGANLGGANLCGANLNKVKNLRHTILPEGDIIGYKKLRNGKIAKILIPKEAKRVCSPIGRKCRAEYAEVLEIRDGRKRSKIGKSQHDSTFKYKVGEIVRPNKFDDDIRVECSNGIHFFITLQEAKEY